ncbi:MAG TPA: VOC family protein [Trebonia sp.]|jgi:catechol-2,3-dioxygenase
MDNGNPVPSIAELGHVGVRCFDTEAQVRFYTTLLGLTVTDHDPQLGTWFLSARPGSEHHELLLTGGRDAARDARLIQQISFRCPRLADVQAFHRRLVGAAVPIDMTVSHGNAVGCYFFDPEGNRCEVYWQTGLPARQPFVQPVDLTADPDTLLAAVTDGARRYGDDGYTTDDYIARSKTPPRPPAAGAAAT